MFDDNLLYQDDNIVVYEDITIDDDFVINSSEEETSEQSPTVVYLQTNTEVADSVDYTEQLNLIFNGIQILIACFLLLGFYFVIKFCAYIFNKLFCFDCL